jgi:hypothetical protein
LLNLLVSKRNSRELFDLEALKELIENSAKQLHINVLHLNSLLYAVMLECCLLENGILVKNELVRQFILFFSDFYCLSWVKFLLFFGHLLGLFFVALVIVFLFHFINEVAKLMLNLAK